MSLEEIKDQVAKEFFNCNWNTLACEETGMLTLEKAAENADYYGSGEDLTIDRSTIRDPGNIVIVK